MAIFVPRFVRQLRDVLLTAPADGEVLTYDSADQKWKNEAGGGGGGLTFAQILAALAAIGVTIDPVSGAVTLSPTGDVHSLHLTPPAFTVDLSYVPLRVERPGGSASFAEDLFNVELDGTFWVTPPGESDDYYLSLKGNVRQCRYYTGKITDGTFAQAIISWGAEPGVDNQTLGFYAGTTPVVQQTAASVGDLWTALKNYGLLDAGSSAPAVGGAPSTATYITQTPDAGLSAEQALSALATGLVKNTTGTGVLSIAVPGTDYPSQAAFDDHSARHENGGADEISVAGLSGLLADAQTPLSHAHAGEDITSGTVADARIASTIARDSEVAGLAALVKLDDFATPDDNTDLNASTTKHGLLRKLSNTATEYLDGSGAWSTPAGAATSLDGLSDAAVSSPLAGQELAYDGTNFVNIAPPPSRWSAPAGALAETYPRERGTGNATLLVSQRLGLWGIYLPKGLLCTSITCYSATQPLVLGVNQFFGLYDDSAGSSGGAGYALLRGTNDDGATAWAANTAKTLTLTSTYTTLRAGLFYIGVLVNATTVPGLACGGTLASGALGTTAPFLIATSSTGQTSLPNPAGSVAGATNVAYLYAIVK